MEKGQNSTEIFSGFSRDTRKKGQSSVEFMILVGFLLFAFVTFMAVISGNMSDKIRERQNQRLYDVAIAVRSEIDLAHGSMDGYSRSFNLPLDAGGKDYEVILDGGLVSVRTVDGSHALALTTKNVTGTVVVGVNNITRENGVIEING